MKKILASWARVMIVAVLIKFMDLGGDIFALNLEALKHLIQAAVASLVPVIIRYVNPNDDAFGIVKEEKDKVN